MNWVRERIRPDLRGLALPDWTRSEDADLSYMLLTRMLLSALADADYSASAEHYDPDYRRLYRNFIVQQTPTHNDTGAREAGGLTRPGNSM